MDYSKSIEDVFQDVLHKIRCGQVGRYDHGFGGIHAAFYEFERRTRFAWKLGDSPKKDQIEE